MELYINNVTKIYGKQKVLKGINMNFLGPGLICFIGPSGSGKSTSLNLIAGLDTVNSGEIIVNSIDVTNLNNKELVNYRNHHIGFIFQDFFLIKHLNVLDNIMLSGLMNGTNPDIVNKQALEIIASLGLIGKENKYPNKLSGGEKQRIAIARALINNPEVILADEPTGNLDSKNSHNVFQMLKKISKDKLVIVVTHDLDLAKQYSDKIYEMSDGKIINEDDISSYEYENIEMEVNKISLNIKTIATLAYRHLLSKRGKLISILISLILSLTFLSLLLNLRIGSINFISDYYETNNNINIIETSEKPVITEDNFLYYNNFIYDDTIKNVKNISNVDDVVVNYNDILDSVSLSYKGHEYNDNSYEVFNINDYFKTRFKKMDIIGNNPSNSNEIILSMALAEEINKDSPESLIGENMLITYNNEYVKVVGISPISYYSTDMIDSIISSIDYSNLEFLAVLPDNYYDLYIETVTNDFIADSSKKHSLTIMSEDDFSESLISGNYPTQDNEVIVSSSLFTTITGFSTNDFQNENIYIINPYFGNKDIVKITGIYQSDEKTIVLNNTLLSSLMKANYTSINVYVDNYKNVSNVTSKINSLGLKYDTSILRIIKELDNNLRYLQIFLGVFIGIMLIITVVITFSIVSSNATERTNEIGILKALGAKNRNIINMFNIEAFIISIIAIFIIIILTLILDPIGNYIFYNKTKINYSLLTFSFTNIFIIFLLSILITIFSSFIPSYRASRLKPADALRK